MAGSGDDGGWDMCRADALVVGIGQGVCANEEGFALRQGAQASQPIRFDAVYQAARTAPHRPRCATAQAARPQAGFLSD